jgi:hypothetical protein
MTGRRSKGRTLFNKVKHLLENTEVEEERKEELLSDLRKDFDKAFEGHSAGKVTMLLSYRNSQPPIIVGNPDILQAARDNGHAAGPDPEKPQPEDPDEPENPGK